MDENVESLENEDEKIVSKNDSCDSWTAKNFSSIFLGKKCKTCKFFKKINDYEKGVCSK